MKKIFTLLSFLAFTNLLFGQADERIGPLNSNKSRLSVGTYNGVPLKVMVNGSIISGRGHEDGIQAWGIRPGYHNIKVYRLKNDRYGYGNGFGRGGRLLYEGNIYIKPLFHVDIFINRFGKAFVDEKRMGRDYYEGFDEPGYDDGWGINDEQPMDNREFSRLLSTLKNESFDNTRVVLAKQAIENNRFTSQQVKEMIQLFSFENNKLDIAKYAYKYTLDKKNYFLLNDAFEFSRSKEDLAKYIQNYH